MTTQTPTKPSLQQIAQQTQQAARQLAQLTSEQKNKMHNLFQPYYTVLHNSQRAQQNISVTPSLSTFPSLM